MADAAMNFRSSIHGFNRDDVVAFIEKTSLEHEKDLRALRDANARLQAELEEARLAAADTAELDAAKEELAAAKTEAEALKVELAKLQEEYDALEAKQAEQAPAPKEETPLNAPMPSVAQLQQAPQKDYSELELAAYRRAEVTERLARERAGKIYEQLEAVFSNANARFGASENDMNTLSASLQTNMEQLQQLLATIRNIQAETEASFRAVGQRNREYAEENK